MKIPKAADYLNKTLQHYNHFKCLCTLIYSVYSNIAEKIKYNEISEG